MPIDPSIPLSLNKPTGLDPLAVLKTATEIREAQQRSQANALALQKAQRDAQTQQMLDRAYAQYVRADGTVDSAGLLKQLAGAGFGHAVTATGKSIADYEEAVAKATEAKGKADSAQAEVAGSIGAGAKAILDAGGSLEDAAGLAVVKLSAAAKKGLIPQDDLIRLTQSLDPSNPERFHQTLAAMLSTSEQTKRAHEQAQTKDLGVVTEGRQAELPGKVAESAIATGRAANMQGGLLPAEQATIANQEAQRRQEQQRIGLEGARVGIERQRLEQADPTSDKNQQRLEQQYRGVLQRAVSSRSGALGIEDSKVNQAIHLLALFDQNKDANGNYHLPKSLQTEAALGLARLLSPSGQIGIQLEQEINQRSVQGDVANVLSYITSTPVSGDQQGIFKMFRDSIERQGIIAQQNRQGHLDVLKGQAPTDLDPARREKLDESLTKFNQIPQGGQTPTTQSSPKSVGRYNPATGKIEYYQPQK